MGKEFELKYAATAAQLAAIRAAYPGQYTTISMETIYYDTPDNTLSARKWTLRRRLENGMPVCTLKTPDGPYGRGEWACRCDSIEEAVSELCKLGVSEELPRLTAAGLVPICGARFIRHACMVPLADGAAELALDKGILLGGGREHPFAEVEMELKTGSEVALLAFAQGLAVKFHLTAEPRSKFQRAFALTKGE